MGNKVKENKKRFMYPGDFEKMFDYLNKNGKHTARILIGTGRRINECRHIKRENLAKDESRRSIIITHSKVRAKLGERKPEQKIISVSSKLFNYLKDNLDNHRFLSTNAFNVALKKACKKAGIDNPEEFSAHNIRKTFATWMLSLGVDGFKLAQHLGHTPNELAKDYATNDVFSHKDKEIMRTILGDLPQRFFPSREY